MKFIRVQYTVKPEYVATNQANIQRVMEDVKALGRTDYRYASFLLEDGQSFMHLSFAETDEAAKALTDLESFTRFRTELKASQPIKPPKAEPMSLVGAGWDIFEK